MRGKERMIINVKKYLLIGAKEEIDQFFSALSSGDHRIHPSSGKRAIELPAEVQTPSMRSRSCASSPLKNSTKERGTVHYAMRSLKGS